MNVSPQEAEDGWMPSEHEQLYWVSVQRCNLSEHGWQVETDGSYTERQRTGST